VAALLLLLPPCILVPAALRVRGLPEIALAALVVAAAEIVLIAIALTPLSALTAEGILVGEALAAVAAVAGWMLAGRPAPHRPARPAFADVRTATREHPVVALIVVLALAVLGVELLLALAVRPNNWDSMAYHMARVAYWLQQDSLEHFQNGTVRQLANPINVEVLQAAATELFDTDRAATLVQWVAVPGLATAIFCGARLLGFAAPAAVFAGALFTLLPQPIMQATSTQNDLMTGLFIATALVFGARGLRDRHRGELAVAAIALGLAVGAKGTALFALPAIALVLAVAVFAFRPPLRILAWGAGLGVAGLIALGSFNYALNLDTYDDPLGGLDTTSGGRYSTVPGNLLRVGWSFADTPGIDARWLSLAVDRPARLVFGEQNSRWFTGYGADASVQEDTIGYGLVCFLLLPVLLVVALLHPRSRPGWRVLAGAALVYLLVLSIYKEHDPWIARLAMPMVVLAAPLFALLYARGWLRTLAIALAVASAAPALLTNPQKPLLVAEGEKTLFGHSDVERQTFIRPEMRQVLASLNLSIEPGEPLGLVRDADSWDYVFFGADPERRVVPLQAEEATPERMRDEGLAGVVYANVEPPVGPSQELAPGYWLVLAPDQVE
jgi:hypothetical protein